MAGIYSDRYFVLGLAGKAGKVSAGLRYRRVAFSSPSRRSTVMVESGSGAEAMMSFATAFSATKIAADKK